MNAIFIAALLGQTLDIPHHRFTLASNRLEVIVSQDARSPVVAVNVWYKTAATADYPLGFAHALRYSMLRATADGTPLFEILAEAGARDAFGAVSLDRTAYFETMPRAQLDTALWVEAQRMLGANGALDPDVLSQDRQALREERRRLEREPYAQSTEAMFNALFPDDHPYHGFALAPSARIAQLDPSKLRRYHRAAYSPSNATLTIVGDVDMETIHSRVLRHFGSIPARLPLEHNRSNPPELARERRIVVAESVPKARIQIGWRTPSAFSQENTVAELLAEILTAAPGGTLREALGESASDVFASQQALIQVSAFTLGAVAAPDASLEEIETAIDTMLETIRRETLNPEVVSRAGERLVLKSLKDLERASGRAESLNRHHHVAKDADAINNSLDRFNEVGPEELMRFAKRWLRRDRRVIVITTVRR
ncbi:MAG: pitrilysin family protein [Myxococcota bacterium]